MHLSSSSSTNQARFTPTLNAYSFLEQLNANLADPKTGIDLFGVCDFCVKHDIEAVDLTGYFFLAIRKRRRMTTSPA